MKKHNYYIPRDSREAISVDDIPENLSLALSKYIPWLDGNPVKKDDLNNFLKKITRLRISKDLLEAVRQRQTTIINTLRQVGFEVLELKMDTASRTVVGLGSNTILETGITLHPIYGFPYLPASALKGLTRAYLFAETTDFERNIDRAKKQLIEFDQRPDVLQLFGGSNEKESQVGSVIFFDGIPMSQPYLEIDIQTPHYQKYYGGNDVFPSNTEAPIPITFLTVAGGVEFRIILASRKKDAPQLKKAEQYLIKGLELLGIGGKTASGYGRFKTLSFEEYTEKTVSAKEVGTVPQAMAPSILDKEGNVRKEFLDGEGNLLPFEECIPVFKSIWNKISKKRMKKKYAKLQKHFN